MGKVREGQAAVFQVEAYPDREFPAQISQLRLAPETVEFDCSAAEEASLLDGFGSTARRLRVGRRLMIYLEDSERLLEHIHGRETGERRPIVVRPTNLEDVFLSLTGTSLEGVP